MCRVEWVKGPRGSRVKRKAKVGLPAATPPVTALKNKWKYMC